MYNATVKITDSKALSKAIHKNNYLIVFILLVFVIIDFDMLSVKPKFITLESSIVNLILVFQVIFIISIYVWSLKKRTTLTILNNGFTAKGNYTDTVSLKANSTSRRFYLHTYKYKVSNKKHEIVLKNNNSSADKSILVIYHKEKTGKSLVYNGLSKAVKACIEII